MKIKANLLSVLGVTVVAATLGAGNVHAQAASSGKMGEAGANTMNAAGKTEANREGRMSPRGQNATSSIDATGKHAPMHSGASSGSSSGKMGEAGADTMNAAGKTEANREGRMSPRGQNATSSVAPKTGMPSDGK